MAEMNRITEPHVASDLTRHAIWLKNPASPALKLCHSRVTNYQDESEVEFLEDLDEACDSDDPLDCQTGGLSRLKREVVSPIPGELGGPPRDVKPSAAQLLALTVTSRPEGGVATAHDLDQVGQPVGSAAAQIPVSPETTVVLRPAQSEDEESELDVDGSETVSADSCKSCGAVFTKAVHRLRHNCDSMFRCSSCGWRGTSRTALARHEVELHQRQKPHECLECGTRCLTSTALLSHLKVHAKGKTTCACRSCGADFTTLEALRKHEQYCRGLLAPDVKPILKHSKALAEGSGFVCKICCAILLTKRSLLRHAQTAHTLKFEHKCQTCVSSFKSKIALTKHIKVHSQERLFSCSECGLCFAYRSELLQHLKVHMAVSTPLLMHSIKKELGTSEGRRRSTRRH